MERKNPLALIRAFRMAFASDEPAVLVFKTSFSEDNRQAAQRIHDATSGDDAIKIINGVCSDDETIALMSACDAFVSLHRSEGLGLSIAEAMLLGKPVIATGYSGNMDFMNGANSLLVDYEMVRVGAGVPAYHEDMRWADPSVEHAAQLMRRLFDDRDYAAGLGAKGKADIAAKLSVEAAGRRMAQRIKDIEAGLLGRAR